jgi:hypothetical protein
VFAGAAREAVFSKPEVIAAIDKHFIPVALKAATMGNPPPGIEGDLYRELRRTQAAPQGICVMNSAGKALAWSLGFDDDESVLGFFDHAKERYDANPDRAVVAERYQRFPSVKMADVADNGAVMKIPDSHSEGEHCPGDLPLAEGSIAGRIVGRAYGEDGEPLSEVRTQENYVEDILEFTQSMQDQLLAASEQAEGRFRIPHALARELVASAYLGMLDVNPLGGDQVRAETSEEVIALWGERHGAGRVILSGNSRVRAKNREGDPRDAGRLWSHLVDLEWRGFADMDGEGVREIVVVAEGHEVLQWGGPGSHVSPAAADNPVAFLLGGRPLDIASAVRYGIVAQRAGN